MRVSKLAVVLAVGAGVAGCKSIPGTRSSSTLPTRVSAERAYEVAGTISKISSREVTIAREGLPIAKLEVAPSTEVTLNGTKVAASALPEGGIARARFELDEDKPVAIRLEVETQSDSRISTPPGQSESSPPSDSMAPSQGSTSTPMPPKSPPMHPDNSSSSPPSP